MHQAGHVEGLGCCMLSTLARAPDSLSLGGKPKYVTEVDKPINTPRISWQACMKRSMQFDQTLSLGGMSKLFLEKLTSL